MGELKPIRRSKVSVDELLHDALNDSSEMEWLAVVAVNKDGNYSTGFSFGVTYSAIGAVEMLKSELLVAMDEQTEEEDGE